LASEIISVSVLRLDNSVINNLGRCRALFFAYFQLTFLMKVVAHEAENVTFQLYTANLP